MENRAYALIAGVFTVLLAAGIVVAANWLSRTNIQYKTYVLVARSAVSGLNPEAQVRMRGVIVGQVQTIRFDPEDPLQVLVRIEVDETTPVTQGTYATLGLQGITGLSYVSLDDEGAKPTLLATSDADPARLELHPSFIDQVSESGQQLVTEAGETARRLNALLSDANQQRLIETLANIEMLSKRMIAVADQLEPAIAGLPKVETRAETALSRAETTLAEFQQLAKEARQHLIAIEKAGGSVQRVGSSWTALGDHLDTETVPAVNSTITGISRTNRSFEHLADELRREPQSLLFGRAAPEPGPGEPGFMPPQVSPK